MSYVVTSDPTLDRLYGVRSPELDRCARAENPDPAQTLAEALRLHRAGLTVLPTWPDGSKAPACGKWTFWKDSHPSEEIVFTWFGHDPRGICLLAKWPAEFLDFDDHGHAGRDTFHGWADQVPEPILSRLWVGTTPKNGWRVGWTCTERVGPYAAVLARAAMTDDPSKAEPLVELLSAGHVVLIPGGDVRAHHVGRPYRTVQGDLAKLPEISGDERDRLVEAARRFNEWVDPDESDDDEPDDDDRSQRIAALWSRPDRLDRPGEWLNRYGDWAEILEPHGWEYVGGGSVKRWRRPGSDSPHSATSNYHGSNQLYVFSTSAKPLEAGRSYTCFHAYAVLNCGGDFADAADKLRAKFAREEPHDDWLLEMVAERTSSKFHGRRRRSIG